MRLFVGFVMQGHRVSCGPLAVINIGTGYLNRPNWLLAGYSVYHRVASQGFPAHNVYDRPAIWAPARSDSTILRQGMHMKIFSKVYCDRVYFLCTERIATGSGFRPPAAPPVHMKVECPPPPPPGAEGSRWAIAVRSPVSSVVRKILHFHLLLEHARSWQESALSVGIQICSNGTCGPHGGLGEGPKGQNHVNFKHLLQI